MKDSSSETFLGVQNGDFKAVRFNETGYRDSALNPTLELQTTSNGDTTTVVVSIDDINPMYGVALDLHYDTSKYTPVETSFEGLVADPIELSASKGDYVTLAQASLAGVAERDGVFATVTFSNVPNRTVSAAGDSHLTNVNTMYDAAQLSAANQLGGFMLTKTTAEDGAPATGMVYGVFATGDGDQNGESNGGDLVPMVALGWFNDTVSDTNFAPAVADYDGNGEVGSADMVPLGQHLGEATSSIEFLLGDDDTFETTDAAVFSMNWADGTYTSPTPSTALTDWADVYRTWAPEFTMAQLQAADTNEDGTVYVSARTANSSGVGPAFTGLELTYVAFNPLFNITDITAEIVGNATTPVADATNLDVIANESLTLDVTGISGTYDATPFTPGDHSAVPGTEYEDTLADVAGMVTWTFDVDSGTLSTAGDIPDNPSIAIPAEVTGTGQTVMIYPDDDPDYGVGTPEGTLVVHIDTTASQINVDDIEMTVNVAVDPVVPIISDIVTDQGATGTDWYLNSVGESVVTATFNFGTTVIAEADFEDMAGQLFNLDGGNPVDLTVVPSTEEPAAGEAFIIESFETPGEFYFTAVVGINVIPGDTYALRISVPEGTESYWSSINKPDIFLVVMDPPAPADFVTLPGAAEVSPQHDELWIYYPDPKVRRNPTVTFGDGTVEPFDEVAYKDFLKSTGDEFPLTNLGTKVGGEGVIPFPEVIVINDTDPSGITSTTTGEPSVDVATRTPNYLVVDITAITTGGIGSTENYAFKIFGAAEEQANWPNLGTGTFDVAAMDIDPPSVDGEDFGINIFNGSGRGDLALGSRDFSDKTLDGSTVQTSTPDVLFVEFNGGRSDDVGGTNNVELIFENTASSNRMTVPLRICIVGVGTDNLNRIGMRDFQYEDFTNPGQPGWPGVLDAGNSYNLILDSPLQAGSDDFTFGTALVVTGTNPND